MKGEAEVFPKPGKSFDPAQIPKAIKDAGFSAPEVVVTAKGTLAKRQSSLELEVPGLKRPFVLAGGAEADALAKRVELIGRKVRLTGKLKVSGANLPPTLTVENFELVAETAR